MAINKKEKEKFSAVAAGKSDNVAKGKPVTGIKPGDTAEDASEYYSYMSQKLLDEMIDKSASYTYDVNLDPLYKQYKDMYHNEGKLAAKDIFGLAGALTGGYGNSYASVAAAGAYSGVMDKLADTGLMLEEKNYNRHKDSISALKNAFDAYSDKEDKAYEKKIYEDERLLRETEKAEEAKKEEQEQAEKEKEQILEFAYKAAENGDYRYLEALGVDVSNLRQQDAFNDAEFLAKYKDYSGLKSLGININGLLNEDLSEQAELFAKYGDYSVLKELGVDLSQMKEDELLALAEVFAKYGDYSLLKSLGADTSDREEEEYYDRLLTWARYLRALRW